MLKLYVCAEKHRKSTIKDAVVGFCLHFIYIMYCNHISNEKAKPLSLKLHGTLLLSPSACFRRLSPTVQPIPLIWGAWCNMSKDCTHMPLCLVLVCLWEGELA